jgi:hypothetical protein
VASSPAPEPSASEGGVNTCPKCGTFLPTVPLPIDPLFSREEVCALVPIRYSTLRSYLTKHAHLFDPPIYMGNKFRPKRMYSASDLRALRNLRVRSTPR